jgi:hypothetical protein
MAPMKLRITRGSAALALVFLSAAFASQPVAGSSVGYRLIVHESNAATQISRNEVALLYLGEPRQWPSGESVVPVDQSAKAPVREVFSQDVLGRTIEAVQAHWMKAIVSGKGRPPLTASEEEILAMVARRRGMIAYVSAGAALPPGVKVLAVR